MILVQRRDCGESNTEGRIALSLDDAGVGKVSFPTDVSVK
jgi:hypothetical protein